MYNGYVYIHEIILYCVGSRQNSDAYFFHIHSYTSIQKEEEEKKRFRLVARPDAFLLKIYTYIKTLRTRTH